MTLAGPRLAAGVAVGGVAVASVASRRRAVVVAAGIGVALAAASSAAHLHALRSGPVAAAAARHADAELLVRLVRDPQRVRSSLGTPLVVTDATVLEVLGRSDQSADSPVLLLSYGAGWTGLLPGQRLVVTGRVSPPRPHDDVAAVVDVRGRPRLVGRPPWWQRAAGHARTALMRACQGLPADPRGLLPGLVDGDTSEVPATLEDDLRVTGLTHLEAVSGENLSIVLAVVMSVARAVGLRRRSRVLVAAVAVLGFVALARPSPSVLRAAVMSGVMLVAMLAGRRTSAVPALSFAVLVLVVVDPFLARSVGFVLSVMATAAIVVIAPAWSRRLERRLPAAVAAAVAVPAAAQLACTPVLVLAFGQLTPYAVPANLLAALAVAPATVLGVVGAAVASVSVDSARPIVWLAALPTAFVGWTAQGFARLPGAGLRLPVTAAAVVAAVVTGWLVVLARRRARDGLREIL